MSETRPVFSNINDGNGLLQEIERICKLGAAGITGNATLLKDFTVRVNNGLDRFYSLAFLYDTNWVFDDRTHGDDDATKGLPVLSTSLVSGVGDYLFDTDILMVTQVFAKDSANGDFKELKFQDDIEDPESYLEKQDNGVPSKYELVGNSILITPKPNYNSTSGLKVVCKRIGSGAIKFRLSKAAHIR